jgi:hypothetical protein
MGWRLFVWRVLRAVCWVVGHRWARVDEHAIYYCERCFKTRDYTA